MDQPKVLVVENDEAVLLLISHILSRQSYIVHSALDALKADEMLQREPYAAVLMDLKMPNGGVDLIRKIESRDPSQLRKVIIVTGAVNEVSKVAEFPLWAVVKKPFEVASLVETVRACVSENSGS